jgi:putative ABC transport system ATP-binding protein
MYGRGATGVHALSDVNLSIGRGEMVAVMGASGSGKSTCMNILGCLDTPTEGAYRFQGLEVGLLCPLQRAILRRKYIGFVFQGFNLLPRTSALENVELPLVYRGLSAKERRARAQRALDKVGLAGRETHTPAELSGGQQQRVAIARALVSDPAMVLADEPTGNLDTVRTDEIMSLFAELNRTFGITIIFITHEPEVAEHADRVVAFRDGRIVHDQASGRTR